MSTIGKLWAVGCSVTYGVGVRQEQIFSQLIADELNLELYSRCSPGTSISWAANQILTSDIGNNDLVVWALTGVARYSFFDDHDVEHYINVGSYDEFPDLKRYISDRYFFSNDILHKAKQSIIQVVNFTRKINANLKIGLLPLNPAPVDVAMCDFLKSKKEFVELYDTSSDVLVLDKGTDNLHPGPLTHRHYADQFLKSYYENCSPQV